MASNTRRSLKFDSVDRIPKIIQRLSNYLLNGEITTSEYNSLMAGLRVYLQYHQVVVQDIEISEVREMLQQMKDEGMI